MVKYLVAACFVLVALFVVRLWRLGRDSATMTPALGVSGGRLKPCESAMNCVLTEIVKVPPGALASAGAAIEKFGGKIVTRNATYLHAEFRSSLFGFVDDVEVFVDKGDRLELRSASRVGRSDLGANRKRLHRIKAEMGV